MPGNKKKPKDFNGTDLYRYWIDKFKEHRGTHYQPAVSIMYDQRLLKDLADKHDNYEILLGMSRAILNNISTVRYFVGDIEAYFPVTDYPDIEYHIKESGDSKRKRDLGELRILEAKWFPNTTDNKRKIQLVLDLRDWLENK